MWRISLLLLGFLSLLDYCSVPKYSRSRFLCFQLPWSESLLHSFPGIIKVLSQIDRHITLLYLLFLISFFFSCLYNKKIKSLPLDCCQQSSSCSISMNLSLTFPVPSDWVLFTGCLLSTDYVWDIRLGSDRFLWRRCHLGYVFKDK